MYNISDVKQFNFSKVPIDSFWNTGEEKELKMHKIHAYPAKFPAFITTKALNFAEQKKHTIHSVSDIFCGCGTTAFEAKRNNINFWGCDINPVATLIAKTKSMDYQQWRLKKYYESIFTAFKKEKALNHYPLANERLKYWFKKQQLNELSLLKRVIIEQTPNHSKYRLFFLCAFSNILKPTSKWLTKSIKPQIDPNKTPSNVFDSFGQQFKFMFSADQERGKLGHSNADIITGSFLSDDVKPPKCDLIVTSPPYVTSYEYADLHQLSSLWLEYTDDYKKLRNGSIGSLQQDYNFNREWKRLNDTGNYIVSLLFDQHKSKARSVAKYFLDMQRVAQKSYEMLNPNGMALFVIGNTEYKGVRIDNTKHLAESLYDSGFSELSITKRKISKKILTPYRDHLGKFSTDASGRKVYSEEFILIGRK